MIWQFVKEFAAWTGTRGHLEEGEAEQIRENYEKIKPYMKPEGIAAVEEQGFSVVDIEGDTVTPLIDGRECAYIIEENGCSWCAIEKAWSREESSFRKPISCHMYPIRVKQYQNYEAMNYDQWTICACARLKGEQEGIPVYVFLKDALIRKYGESGTSNYATPHGRLRREKSSLDANFFGTFLCGKRKLFYLCSAKAKWWM